jgi:hypothetical protein
MTRHRAFHPDLSANRVHHVTSLSPDTVQTEGMRRFAGIRGESVGAEKPAGDRRDRDRPRHAGSDRGEPATAVPR